jgi:hypothetical protein
MSIELIGYPAAELTWWWMRSGMLVIAFIFFATELIRERRSTNAMHREIALELTEARKQLTGFGERLAALGAALAASAASSAAEREASASYPPKIAPSRGGYEIAIRLARGGCGVAELMASSGVTRAEAELLCRLHGADATTPAAEYCTRTTASSGRT